MRIEITDLKLERGAAVGFAFSEKLPPLVFQGEEMVFAAPVEVTGQVVNTGYAFLVKGKVGAALQISCSRCLELFIYSLRTDFAALYQEEGNPLDSEDGNDAVDVYPLNGDSIDLTAVVQESIILAVPMKPVCREDCRGLCPQCGQNRNIGDCDCLNEQGDPRLAVLQRLLRKQD